MIPGFEDGLVGAKAGEERVLNLTFPEDYQNLTWPTRPLSSLLPSTAFPSRNCLN